jgi:hypothetical protein
MKRRLIFIVIALVLVVGLIGAYFYFKQTPDVVQDKPDIAVQVKELIAAFDKDTAAARRQFVDKVVEVTGPVKKVDSANAIVFGEEGSSSEVIVGLDRRHLDDYKKVQAGAVATMQGICSGYEKKESSDPTDLIAAMGGTTVQLRSAGVKSKD